MYVAGLSHTLTYIEYKHNTYKIIEFITRPLNIVAEQRCVVIACGVVKSSAGQ